MIAGGAGSELPVGGNRCDNLCPGESCACFSPATGAVCRFRVRTGVVRRCAGRDPGRLGLLLPLVRDAGPRRGLGALDASGYDLVRLQLLPGPRALLELGRARRPGPDAGDRGRRDPGSRLLVVGLGLPRGPAAPARDLGGPTGARQRCRPSRAVPRPQRPHRAVGPRAPAAARDQAVLRLPPVRHLRRRLGSAPRQRPGRPALRRDDPDRTRGRGPFRRRLHVRHRQPRRRHLRPVLQGGAQARAALPAVGRPGLRRDARDRRQANQASPRRQDLRLDVEGGDPLEAGRRDDHELQRVARGDADRAGPRRAARERGQALVRELRGRLRAARQGRGARVPRPDPLLGA